MTVKALEGKLYKDIEVYGRINLVMELQFRDYVY